LGAFVDILVLDAVIGNSDRHQDNWSIVLAPPTAIRLAPSYDHGSSLGRDFSEEAVEDGVPEETLSKYIENGRSRVGWEEDGRTKRLHHKDLLARVAAEHPELAAASIARLQPIERAQCDALINEVPDGFASPGRKHLMRDLLWRRITLTRANLESSA